MKKTEWVITVWFDVRTDGEVWGPFSNRGAAEQIAVALAGRGDVRRIKLEETN